MIFPSVDRKLNVQADAKQFLLNGLMSRRSSFCCYFFLDQQTYCLHFNSIHYCIDLGGESKAESRYLLNLALPQVNWSDIECDLSMCLMTTGYMVNELNFCGQPSSPGINYKSCPAWGHCTSSAEMAFWAIASRKVMSLTLFHSTFLK